MMDAVDVDQKLLDGYRQRFRKITDGDIETQLEFFLKRYILVLGDNWKEVTTLANEFHRYCDSRNGVDLNIIEAADFLQKNGKTRTAAERKAELSDIDLDDNKRICFLEYCLLHFKTMVLTDYFKMRKMSMPKDIDLSKDGVGVTGVGDFILDTLFRFGAEVDPEIEAAIDKVMAERKHREKVMEELQQTANDIKNNQVVRMKAVHELARMEREDTSGPEVELITLLAARRRAQKNGGKNAKVLDEEKKNEEKAKQEKLKQSKQKLGNLKNMFQSNAKVDSTKFVNRAADRASIRAIQSKGLNLNGQGARKDY